MIGKNNYCQGQFPSTMMIGSTAPPSCTDWMKGIISTHKNNEQKIYFRECTVNGLFCTNALPRGISHHYDAHTKRIFYSPPHPPLPFARSEQLLRNIAVRLPWLLLWMGMVSLVAERSGLNEMKVFCSEECQNVILSRVYLFVVSGASPHQI